MVSLTGHEGSFHYLDEGTGNHGPHVDNDSSTDLLLAQSNISSFVTPADIIRKLPTAWAALLQMFFLILFEVVIFLASDVFHLKWFAGVDPPFAFLSILHVALWLLAALLDRYFHYHHHMLRTYGYLDLFTKTKDLRRIPLYLLSLGNAVLLILVSVIGNIRHDNSLSLVRIFQIVASAEVFVLLIISFIYLIKVIRFNKAKALPDAYHQDVVDGFSSEIYKSPEIGYRDSEGLEDLLEKQAEMIRYLQQHNTNLGRMVVELTEQRGELLQRLENKNKSGCRKLWDPFPMDCN